MLRLIVLDDVRGMGLGSCFIPQTVSSHYIFIFLTNGLRTSINRHAFSVDSKLVCNKHITLAVNDSCGS